MVIKILGSGCPKCKKLEENVREATKDLAVEAIIEHVTNFKEIMNYGVMRTPALVVNEKVVSMGKVLKPKDIEDIISR